MKSVTYIYILFLIWLKVDIGETLKQIYWPLFLSKTMGIIFSNKSLVNTRILLVWAVSRNLLNFIAYIISYIRMKQLFIDFHLWITVKPQLFYKVNYNFKRLLKTPYKHFLFMILIKMFMLPYLLSVAYQNRNIFTDTVELNTLEITIKQMIIEKTI